jgi:chitodextrinase
MSHHSEAYRSLRSLRGHTAYLLVAPAGALDSFYIWSTYFVIPAPPADDITAPTEPTALSATSLSSTAIKPSWHSSADNVGVVGYNIYREGTFLESVTGTTAWDTNLSPSSNHCYQVSAYDAAGNESSLSGQVCTMTQQGPDLCAGDPACFPATITLSGAVNGTIQGTGSLKNDWYGYSCTGDLVNRAILTLSSPDKTTSFYAHIVVTNSYGATPFPGTYQAEDFCGDGSVNQDNKKWEWSGGPVAGTYTLVLDSVDIKVVDPQMSVYVTHGAGRNGSAGVRRTGRSGICLQ